MAADTINMRSDTNTLPTEAMLEAMRHAPLGDDVSHNDPTVNRLEALAAEKIGKEAALFVPSGTMGMLICLTCLSRPGDEVLMDEQAHTYLFQAGGFSAVAGLTPRLIRSDHGLMFPQDVLDAVRPANDHFPRPAILCLENTHNLGGGRIIPPDVFAGLCAAGREHGLHVCLDGARIFNAAVGAGVDVRTFTEHVDTVMFCVSKGLSAPVGSLVAGSEAFIDEARRARKRFGGGMRQAGVIAAAGIVALETMVDRLAEDHANARRLADLVDDIDGLNVDGKPVQTNMVLVNHAGLDVEAGVLIRQLAEEGLAVSASSPDQPRLRLVTHRHITADDIERTAAILETVARRHVASEHGAAHRS